MGEIFVVAEHRRGAVRDITYEMLFKAGALCREASHSLTAVLIGGNDGSFEETLARKADKVLAFEGDRAGHFDADLYEEVLCGLIEAHRPFLTFIGHTSWGLDLAPALAVAPSNMSAKMFRTIINTPRSSRFFQKKSPAPAAKRKETIVRALGVNPSLQQNFPNGVEKDS